MQFQKKRCVAMLLAGGQGSRLMVLTENTAKPAVPFGGKYRIIDFPLSNCVNSKIDTVGILTQYQPLELNEYIGNGQPWGLNSSHGGVQVLPPYAKSKNSEWYKGTANAIYQNIPFIERYNPDNVLILSGDHIYKMDYAAMLRFHEQRDSDCTIAVREVPLKEASRFGIMNTREDGSIYEFEEKPKKPKSTNASMGIYIFKWSVLRAFLEADEADRTSENDFGKNIIPAILNAGHKLYAYRFDGYWKDVGTISSLWEANMDLLGKHPAFDIYGTVGHKIYARNQAMPSSFISRSAEIRESFGRGLQHRGFDQPFHHLHRLLRRQGRGDHRQRHHAGRRDRKRRRHPQRDHRRGLPHQGRRPRRRLCGGRRTEDQRHRQG